MYHSTNLATAYCFTGEIFNARCLIQYWFKSGQEHKVQIKPHGNSKQAHPYCRTNPSTMLMLKQESKDTGPKDTVHNVYGKQGGILGAKNLGELPRNRSQVANVRRKSDVPNSLCSKKSIRDPLFMVMEQSKLCEGKDRFVRIVTATPEPMCILATDQQLHDLVRFGTNPSNFSVLSVDPTFSLGDFSVTCITYRHLLVIDPRTGQSPIMLGPVLVHQSKEYTTYHFFVSSLIGIAPNLTGILAFGTDGEAALVKALKQQFCFAVHLRCFRHMKNDIERKLTTDMHFPKDAASQILAHIFGEKIGPTFYEGLVDCDSENDFDFKLQELEEEWKQLEKSNSASPLNFFSWFQKYHAEEFKSCMLRPVRQAAGLGDPPSEFFTNDSEAINSAIKQFLKFKKSDWPTFNENMKRFVMDQQEEVSKTIVGNGQYILKEEYRHLAVTPSRWFTAFTVEQKEKSKRKLQNASVDDISSVNKWMHNEIQQSKNDLLQCRDKDLSQSKVPQIEDEELKGGSEIELLQNEDGSAQYEDGEPSNASTSQNLKGKGNVQQNVSGKESKLSIDLEMAAHHTRIPILVLRQIWSKAADLLVSNQVTVAPGCPTSARMVASKSNQKPHFVSLTEDGRFQCDDACPNFHQRFICSHSVAAAESNGALQNFVESYGRFAKTQKGQQSISPNFTRLSMTNLSRRVAGRKGKKPPAKKSIARRETTPYEQRQPLLTSPPTFDQPSSSINISTSCGNWNWNWDWDGPCSSGTNFSSSFPTCSQPSGMSYPPYYLGPHVPSFYDPLGLAPLEDMTNHLDSFPLGSSFGVSSVPLSGNGAQLSSNHSRTSPSEPFLVKLLNGRIKICAGCKGPHLKNTNNRVLSPPYDICISHKETQVFINPHTGLESSKLGNAYYHVNLTCIRKKHPKFSSDQLECPEDVWELLGEVHFVLLKEALGYTV